MAPKSLLRVLLVIWIRNIRKLPYGKPIISPHQWIHPAIGSSLTVRHLIPQITGRGLVMAMLNINSLLAHIDDLRIFMNNSKIDVLAINETKLDASSTTGRSICQGLRLSEETAPVNGRNGGGVCIYLRSNLNYSIRSDLCDDQLECIVLEITKPRSKPFLISTWLQTPEFTVWNFSRIWKTDWQNRRWRQGAVPIGWLELRRIAQ